MEAGELKSIVVGLINQHEELSLSCLMALIQEQTNREYAQTTIATVLSRLEREGTIVGEKKRKEDRKKTYYHLSKTAHVNEADVFLKDYLTKFGAVGIKHLGDVMGMDLDDKELKALRDKLYKT